MTQDLRLERGQEMVIHQGENTVELHRDGAITVSVGTERIDIRADGKVEVYTYEHVQRDSDAAVHVHPAANESKSVAAAEPRPGDRMADGTIYAGVSPDTGKPMYTMPADAPLTMQWEAAMKFASELGALGHKDWRVPSKAELNVLYENRGQGALKGTFNVTGRLPDGYWSSTESSLLNELAWEQRLSDGFQSWGNKKYDSYLRCVRG